MWYWIMFSWLIGVAVCLFAVDKLWQEGGDTLRDAPWEKR